MKIVVGIHDPPAWSLPATEVERIRTALPDVDVVDARTVEARKAAFPDADVLVATWLRPDEPALLTRVRWIHTTAVGVDALLQPGLVERGVVITNSRGVHAAPIAEHAIALLLALRRGLHVAIQRQASHTWAQTELTTRTIVPLGQATVAVVGLGEIGSRVAALAKGLGMRVVGIRRRTGSGAPAGVDEVRSADSLHATLREADAVILALPQTKGSGVLIDRAALGCLRPTAVLVNVARGGLVDEAALAEALLAGRLGGAGLDAFREEPLAADSPLWDLPNVIVTPHSASFAGDYWGPVVDFFLENLARYRRGAPLVNLVDAVRGY